ncbi:MAG: Holliday junction resolvase RuvX [Crocinitomicaceae bacterium]
MGRLLAIDYGQKRTGIAETDDLQIIASGLTTVNTPELFKFLTQYFAKHKVDAIVLGEPKRLNGEDTHNSAPVEALKQKLNQTFGHIPVKMVDERFTSKMAVQTMIDSGLSKKKRQNKALIDEISATIILQSYMSSI